MTSFYKQNDKAEGQYETSKLRSKRTGRFYLLPPGTQPPWYEKPKIDGGITKMRTKAFQLYWALIDTHMSVSLWQPVSDMAPNKGAFLSFILLCRPLPHCTSTGLYDPTEYHRSDLSFPTLQTVTCFSYWWSSQRPLSWKSQLSFQPIYKPLW